MNGRKKLGTGTVVPVAVAFTLLIGLAITGCTAANHPVTPVPASTRTEKPALNLAKLQVGDAVDESTAWAINGKGGKLHAYKLPNGTYVVINEDQPLPPAVLADVTSVANAAPNDTDVNGNRYAATYAHAVQGTIEYSTGKNVAVIQYGNVASWSGDEFTGYLGIASFYNGGNPAPVDRSEAVVQADLQAAINEQPDPASWIIVVNN